MGVLFILSLFRGPWSCDSYESVILSYLKRQLIRKTFDFVFIDFTH